MNRYARRLKAPSCTFALFLACGFAACGDLPAGDPAAEIAGTSSAIVNGIEPGPSESVAQRVVAIYHRVVAQDGSGAPWFTRPCTGMVFAHQGNESIIITARHCVTTDGNVDSELVPNSWVKVALGPAPGPANPNPPTSGRNPIFIDAMPITSAADYTRDAAIIYLYAPTWAWLADRSIGVHVSPPAPDLTFYAYGYGLNSRDNNCYGNAAYFQSSGILRRGELVTLDGGTVVGQSGYFDYNYTSSGPSVICGDSGGPDVGLIAPNMLWDVFLGEHTLDFPPAMINTSATPGPWMSQAIGGFYVSPVSSPSLNVRRMSDDYVGLDSISVGTPLIYDAVARTITHNNACLDWTSTFNRFVFTGCNTSRPRQQWMATPIGQLVNPASGLCMYHSASGLMEMRSCPPSTATQAERARFTWVWHAQK